VGLSDDKNQPDREKEDSRMSIEWNDGNVQDTAGELICFAKCHGSPSKKASLDMSAKTIAMACTTNLPSPVYCIKSRSCSEESPKPYEEAIFASYIREVRVAPYHRQTAHQLSYEPIQGPKASSAPRLFGFQSAQQSSCRMKSLQ
jgi:hypothetical protein